jgi:hypothetical protein
VIVHLAGDSIFRGYALRRFSEEVSPGDPLWDFRSPWSMANLICEENGIAARFSYYPAQSFVDAKLSKRLVAYIKSGLVQSGDWLVLEDGGCHGSQPDALQASLSALMDRINRSGVKRGVLTMFDYPPAPLDCQFDAKFGGRSINDAIRAAATASGAACLDMNAQMDAWKDAVENAGLPIMHADGIHPNVWGQLRLVGCLMRFVGLDAYVRSLQSIVHIARANWSALSYGAPDWSEPRAAELANDAILSR